MKFLELKNTITEIKNLNDGIKEKWERPRKESVNFKIE